MEMCEPCKSEFFSDLPTWLRKELERKLTVSLVEFPKNEEFYMKMSEEAKKLDSRGIKIFTYGIDCSHTSTQIRVIRELAPILGIEAEAAIFKMWSDFGFELGLEALCESMLMEINEENISSRADEEDLEGDSWDEHLRDLNARYCLDSRMSFFDWDREYTVENECYYFWTGDNPEQEIIDESYENLIFETRILLRKGHFSKW